MKSNCIVTRQFAKDMATTAKGCAAVISSIGLMALLFLFMAVSSAEAQTLQFTFPTVRVTVPVNFSGVVTIPINNTANTNGLGVSTNGLTSFDPNNLGYFRLDPVNLNVSGLPAGATYNITDPNGVVLTQIGNASTNAGHFGYETNNYHTNLLVNLFCTNVAQGIYTFYLNAGGDGSTTPGLPTNTIPLVLQVAHIWNGNGGMEASFGVSNNWTNAASWLGGVPGASDDVVIGDFGGQTNNSFTSGISFTNIGISSNITVASIRFAPTTYTNLVSTNALTHTIQIAPNATLFVTGPNGFSLLRDYIGAFGQVNDRPDRAMTITFIGTNAMLLVSNSAANFIMLHSSVGSPAHTLNMSNLDSFVSYVSQMGIAEYQLFPNYAGLNKAYNGNAAITNQYNARPSALAANVYLARTNFITATYKDPNNYANENRTYALSFEDSEQAGLGSTPTTTLLLGVTNRFLLDSVCFVRANHQGFVRFGVANGGAVFRGTNGTDRLSVFTVSDDGGTTNMANSNVKATVDFAGNNGWVDILADRLYISRDRTLISSNQTPNVQGDLLIGKGNVDVNTAVLGFQEHSNKMDWTAFNSVYQPYLNYCQGRLTVTNGGTFRVNKTLTLGYTADTNPASSAQQYKTFGRVTVYAGSTVIASNIVCDTGRNFYDANKRLNNILNYQGTLIVSNSIGGSPGLPLDSLSFVNGGTLTLFVNSPGTKTNVIVRTLACSGSTPATIKIASLITTGFTYPTNIPLIAYETATPFMVADMSAIVGVKGFLLNDTGNKLITLYCTTNPPNNLVWRGSVSPNWNITETNWVMAGTGVPTNFNLGDAVTFDDSSTVTNINISGVVVPNGITSSNAGVTITNNLRQYTFNAGGAIGGTAQILKTGTNSLTFNTTELPQIFLAGGNVDGSGTLGNTTVGSNIVLNFSGTIAGGLNSTGTVTMAVGSIINGSVAINGGVLVNAGTVTLGTGGTLLVNSGSVTNTVAGTINLGLNTASEVFPGCTMANFGAITTGGGNACRLNINGALFFGNGVIYDRDTAGINAASGRFTVKGAGAGIYTRNSVISPGATPSGSIGSMNMAVRVDLNEGNPVNTAGTLLIEIDQGNNTNDTIWADKWNNLGDVWVMTNLNGTFSAGQVFHVFRNNNGDGVFPNFVDASANWPLMMPVVPGTGLQWTLNGLQQWGTVGVTNCTMVWNGSGTAQWDTNGSTGNWKSGQVYSDSRGAIFNDTAAGSTTVNLATQVGPAGYNYVTNIVAGVTNYLTNMPAFMPGIIVSNSTRDYVFVGAGFISGMTSLYKTGPGTLTVLNANPTGGSTNNNNYSGGVIIDGGTLAFTNNSAFGAVNAASGGQGGGSSAYSQIIVDNCTLKNFGTTNQQFGRALTINQNGVTIEISNTATLWRMDLTILGSGALTKTGPGNLELMSGINYYAGGTFINAGSVMLSAAAAGSNAITIGNGTTLQLTNENAFTFTNAISIAGSTATIMELGTTPQVVSGGAWTGSGTVTLSNASVNAFVFNGVISNYSGTFSFGNSSGSFLLNNSTNDNPCKGSTLATFDLGTSTATLSNFNGGALTYDLGGLSGGAGTILAGRATNNVTTNGATTYSIGANGNNTVFSGKIVDGPDYTSAGGTPSPVTVVKVGTGRLLLNGANTYTGSTTVSNGTLGGTGSIAGALTVVSGATLAPGATIGTFTVGGTATLAGAVVLELNRTNTPATNDQLSVSGTITATGTLVVTNIGPDIITGSKFHLFNKAVTGWSSKTLPATDPTGAHAYTWTDNIGSDGSITLASGGANPVNTNPTNITFSVSGSTLTLSWPADHIGWQLWSNSVSLLRTDMWFQIVGSAATNQMIFTLDPAKTNVFFRLILP